MTVTLVITSAHLIIVNVHCMLSQYYLVVTVLSYSMHKSTGVLVCVILLLLQCGSFSCIIYIYYYYYYNIIIIKLVLIKVTLSCQRHCKGTAQSLTSKKNE